MLAPGVFVQVLVVVINLGAISLFSEGGSLGYEGRGLFPCSLGQFLVSFLQEDLISIIAQSSPKLINQPDVGEFNLAGILLAFR